MNCQNCGNACTADARFCTACGYRLQEVPALCRVDIAAAYMQVQSFAIAESGGAFLRSLVIKNREDTALAGLTLQLRFAPAFAEALDVDIASLPPGQAVELCPLPVRMLPNYFLFLRKRGSGRVQISLKAGETCLGFYEGMVELLPADCWSGLSVMPETIAAFLQPASPALAGILSRAAESLGTEGFTGYARGDKRLVKQQMAALYEALAAEKLHTTAESLDPDAVGVQLPEPEALLALGSGSETALCLLYASGLMAMGLRPLLFFAAGHAYVGAWLEALAFPLPVQDDAWALKRRVAEGVEELGLLSPGFAAGLSFTEAGQSALRALEGDFWLSVDLAAYVTNQVQPRPALLRPSITKQGLWERKLLDMSLRNTLLSFRVTKHTVQLLAADLYKLQAALFKGEAFLLEPCPSDLQMEREEKFFKTEGCREAAEVLCDHALINRRIHTFFDEKTLGESLKALHRQARLSLEENGANTLYLALGFLRWYESDETHKCRFAPILLIPVDILRRVQERSYALRIRDEEAQLNITLFEMLRQDFGIEVEGLDPLPSNENGVDIPGVFACMRRAIMGTHRFAVEEMAFLGLFSFSRFIMWNDIHSRSESLVFNKVVASLVSGRMEWEPMDGIPGTEELDAYIKPADMAMPLPADASQIKAINAAAKGESFVLHGPPGTGKSQTIANMIANALYQGKSVLFVAEKMAALTVVQKRLSALGLSPFCLELHSNKAQKRVVLEQLEASLSVGRFKHPEGFESTARRLHNLRTQLNIVMEELHKKRSCGMTLAEAIYTYEDNSAYKGLVYFSPAMAESMGENSYTVWREILERLRAAGMECGGVKENCFRFYGNREYSFSLREEFLCALESYGTALNTVSAHYMELCKLFGLPDDGSFASVTLLCEIAQILPEARYVSKSLLASPGLLAQDEQIRSFFVVGKRLKAARAALLEDFTEAVFTYDYKSAADAYAEAGKSKALKRRLLQGRLLRELRAMAREKGMLSKEALPALYERLECYHKDRLAVKKMAPLYGRLFESLWQRDPDWDLMEESYAECIALQRCIIALTEDRAKRLSMADRMARAGAEMQPCLTAYAAAVQHCAKLEKELLDLYRADMAPLRDAEDWLDACMRTASEWRENIGGLRAWSAFLRVYDEAVATGLGDMAVAYMRGAITEESMIPAFSCALGMAIASAVLENTPALRRFQGVQFEQTIVRFGESVSEFERLTAQELVARLSARIPENSTAAAGSSEIAILNKAIKNRGRMLPIRKLFDSIPKLLRRICPCLLMSPISVAQYIDPDFPKFDLVIFDEASQIPTCEAVGAIARGENVVVVGDPKQLPPTSFFNSVYVDEENYDKEDLESLLDDCLALSMPQFHLLWHYRSRHESLIAYSNMRFYGNGLNTFPSADDSVSRVHWHPVEGIYERGGTRQNPAEAAAVVAEIMERLRAGATESIGVVSFSAAQQNLIEDMLMEAFCMEPELFKVNEASPEPLFIKNLENVQGDERDIILFSVGYGPDKNGRVSMSFGPINRDGGWRRLNVAVTRARKEMHVYSVLRPEQIDISRSASEGVAALKGFLAFARDGKGALALGRDAQPRPAAALGEMIAARVRALGYMVACSVGCSAYRMDLAVLDPRDPARYLLGIMLDEKSRDTARDRYLLHPGILRELGWRLHRVWMLDWFDNPERELHRIRGAIERALLDEQAETEKPERVAPLQFEREEIEPCGPTPYRAAVLDISGTPERFYLDSEGNRIMDCLLFVVNTEAPISRKLLWKRVLACYGIVRAGSRVDAILDELIASTGIRKRVFGDTVFYWKYSQQPETYAGYRVPAEDGEKRSMDDICPEETANAIQAVMEQQLCLSRQDLVRETARLFGFTRLGSVIESAVSAGLAEALHRGYVTLSPEDGRVMGF